MKYGCRTRFDITVTGVTGHYKLSRVPFTDSSGQEVTDEYSWNYARNQQRNWETITQLISLRAQITNMSNPVKKNGEWSFTFEVETAGAYGSADDPVSILRADSAGVPMLIELDDEANIEPLLVVDGAQQNIWFWIEQ